MRRESSESPQNRTHIWIRCGLVWRIYFEIFYLDPGPGFQGGWVFGIFPSLAWGMIVLVGGQLRQPEAKSDEILPFCHLASPHAKWLPLGSIPSMGPRQFFLHCLGILSTFLGGFRQEVVLNKNSMIVWAVYAHQTKASKSAYAPPPPM